MVAYLKQYRVKQNKYLVAPKPNITEKGRVSQPETAATYVIMKCHTLSTTNLNQNTLFTIYSKSSIFTKK